MKTFIATILLSSCSLLAWAQEEASYYLPRTALRFTITVEKSSYTPGDFCQFSERFLKKRAESLPSELYRILNVKVENFGVPDTTKKFPAKTDPKRNINMINRDANGILLSINSKLTAPRTTYRRLKPVHDILNPRDYMSQEILSAGSQAKMAELTAQEIYNIRDSKIQLSRGQADFMPNDGEQMKIMLRQLDTQEAALLQTFEGVTLKDTLELHVEYMPEKEVNREPLFRFSKHFGLVDADDLSGTPYYITIEDQHNMPTIMVGAEQGKKEKKGEGIFVNLPGKIKVTVNSANKTLLSEDVWAAQFGRMEMIDPNLFSKKLTTSIILDPATGNLESIKTIAEED